MSDRAETTGEELWGRYPNILVGYLWAVSGATLSYAFVFWVNDFAEGAPSRVLYPDGGIWSFLIPVFVMGALFWFFALPTAALPFAATCVVALKFKIRSVVYYLACGALTALMLTPVFVVLWPQLLRGNDGTFGEDCLVCAPMLLFCGSCAALAFWYRAGRHIGRA